jgi:hypothetical protein
MMGSQNAKPDARTSPRYSGDGQNGASDVEKLSTEELIRIVLDRLGGSWIANYALAETLRRAARDPAELAGLGFPGIARASQP